MVLADDFAGMVARIFSVEAAPVGHVGPPEYHSIEIMRESSPIRVTTWLPSTPPHEIGMG
jgi:hypothetical protein